MPKFVQTTDGDYLNLDHVARFAGRASGRGYSAYSASGENLGTVEDVWVEDLSSPITCRVPDTSGCQLLMVWFEDGAGPALISRAPVIAWEVRDSRWGCTPVTIDEQFVMGGYTYVVELPETYGPFRWFDTLSGQYYETLEASVEAARQRWLAVMKDQQQRQAAE